MAPQPNTLFTHTLEVQQYKKSIHGECIMSGEKKKKPTLYENIPATLFLNTKPLPIICFQVARSPFNFFCTIFSFFSKTSKIQSTRGEWDG